jgi:hypothetical protein
VSKHLRIGILAASVSLIVVALFASGAGAGSEAAVSVKIKNGPPAFHGKVKSPDSQLCVSNRPVLLKKQKKNGGNKTLGATTTDAKGNWTIKVNPLKSGSYFAKAPKLIDVAPAISCIGAKSDVKVVD